MRPAVRCGAVGWYDTCSNPTSDNDLIGERSQTDANPSNLLNDEHRRIFSVANFGKRAIICKTAASFKVGAVISSARADIALTPDGRELLFVNGDISRIDAASGLELYGNLYSNLLDYVVFAVLFFYVLTIAGLFRLRRTQPGTPRPYRAVGYPLVPTLYIATATIIMLVLLVYRTQTTWPGLLIVLTGIPVYFLWKREQ